MRIWSRFFRLLALGVACTGAFGAEPAMLHQATMHDAFYGLCLDGQEGIAVGEWGSVAESADGGTTWSSLPPLGDTALLDVSCGGGASLIVGQMGAIYRLQDGKYQPVVSGTDARLLGVGDNSKGLAIAVGGFGTVLRSTDDGRTWEPLAIDWQALINDFMEPHLYAVDVSDEGVITIVGEFELVVRSLDGGDTWETMHKGEASLFGLSINDDGTGYAVGQDGMVIKTENGGESWSAVPVPTEGILLEVWSSPTGEVLITGIRNLLYSRDAGHSWDSLEGGDISVGWYQGLAVVPGADASGEVALLAGNRGNILQVQLR